MALPRRAAVAGAPAKDAPGFRVPWSEPEPWIVAVLLVTGVAVAARHPIARAIGTESDDATMTPSVVASAGPAPSSAAGAPAAAAAPVPTHAPRNPFHALVGASGALLSPGVTATAGLCPD